MNMGQDRQMPMLEAMVGISLDSVQNVRNQNGLIVVSGIANQNSNRNGNVVAAQDKGNAVGNNGIQLQAKEFDLMAVVADLDEIEEVNANCILMANLQQTSTSDTQTDKAPVYDLDGPVEVSIVEQGGGTIDQNPATVEETHSYFESLYNNLAIEVEKVNTVNLKLRETNADLTTELPRYKNQEKYFEISQEKYDKLERSFRATLGVVSSENSSFGIEIGLETLAVLEVFEKYNSSRDLAV
nr:hypothetical protein [Tanacetum cinerariifolium]